MQRCKKKLIILSILVLTLLSISTITLGTLVDTFEGSITTDPQTDDIKDIGGRIVGIIQVIGTMVSVGMMIIIGIRYVMGSADQKAEYRKSMTPYIVGAVLIFGATNLTQIIYEWAHKI